MPESPRPSRAEERAMMAAAIAEVWAARKGLDRANSAVELLSTKPELRIHK